MNCFDDIHISALSKKTLAPPCAAWPRIRMFMSGRRGVEKTHRVRDAKWENCEIYKSRPATLPMESRAPSKLVSNLPQMVRN